MTTRLLPRAEWSKLAGTEADQVWAHLPETAQVVAVEADDRVVGAWVLLPMYHVECLWIDPAHRKTTGVARRLWVGMRRLLQTLGVQNVITGCASDDVRTLLAHVGAEKLPDCYVMRFSLEGL